jgi:acyl transferase domain-containing protein
LVDLLESWNIRPTAVIGHSSGEIAAAYCAGGLSHKSAVQAAYYKGLLVSKLLKEQPNSGAMISVALSETGIQKYLTDVTQQTGESLVVGCVNSPDNVTVTGGTRATGELATRMQQENIFGRVIPTGIAYHSSFMDAISVEYASKLGDLESREMPGKAPRFFSSVYGKEVPAQDTCTSTYWVDNLVGQVKFSSALQDMVFSLLEERKKGGMNKSGRDIMIEIGPHAALQRPIKDTIKNISSAKEIEYNSTLERNVHAVKSMCGFAGRLRSSGVTIDILHVNFPDIAPVTVQVLTDLPAYPFNHETKYWVESRLSRNFRFRQHSRHELLGSRETDWNPLWPKWRNVIRLAENGWILDHQVRAPLSSLDIYVSDGYSLIK